MNFTVQLVQSEALKDKNSMRVINEKKRKKEEKHVKHEQKSK